MFACFFMWNNVIYCQPFLSKGSCLQGAERGANYMTNPELILKLVEMLLAERDKNNLLQAHLEKNKKSEG